MVGCAMQVRACLASQIAVASPPEVQVPTDNKVLFFPCPWRPIRVFTPWLHVLIVQHMQFSTGMRVL